MGRKLPPRKLELYKRCDEILHYMWDPIGVCDTPEARDEYHGYLPHVFGLLTKGVSEQEIAAYLVAVESGRMGVTPNKAAAQSVAEVLVAWRECLSSDDD